MRRAAGFTLIELLIVVALVAILGAVTVPQVAEGLERYAVISAGQQVASTIRAARFQAVGKNTQLRVRFNYPAAGQYQVVLHSNGTTAMGEVQQLPGGVSFQAGFADVAFDTNGRRPTGALASTIVVTNGNAADDRTVTVSTSGRVQLQ
ncbi:MAG: GspH/FimT family pseudopilin [Acidobacteria bacterium]|nr:GspH/FimT family pseudopilin [Acidobacteriota bacterium]